MSDHVKYNCDMDYTVVPFDGLTRGELERLIKLAREVKSRKVDRLTVEINRTNGGLFIAAWRKAH